MNGQDNEDIQFEKYEEIQFIFNVTDFLKEVVHEIKDEPAQQRLTLLLHDIEMLDVPLVESIKKSGTETASLLMNFLNNRIAENRSALKLKQIFGFFRADRIEREASDRAHQETTRFFRLVSLSNDPAFRRIIVDRQRLIREILDEIHNLLERGVTINITPQQLAEILRWIRNQKFLST